MKISKLRTLMHNIKFLSSTYMEELYWNNMEYQKIAIKYGRLLAYDKEKRLNILDSKSSLDLLLREPKSFYRFGDGEIEIMNGGFAGTQKYDPVLSEKLMEALTTVSEKAYVGIGYDYFDFNLWSNSEFSNRFYLLNASKYREFYLEHCRKDVTYIDTGFSQRYFNMDPSEKEEWFCKVKSLFKGKKITVFMGEQAYSNLDYYVFDEAETIDYVFCPSKDAFDVYEELLDKARKRPLADIICLAVGATSKVLAFELIKDGYTVYDIGHMPKDYDSYMKKLEVTRDNAEGFYLEDYRLK